MKTRLFWRKHFYLLFLVIGAEILILRILFSSQHFYTKMLYCAFLDNRIFISTRWNIARNYEFVEAINEMAVEHVYHFIKIFLYALTGLRIKRKKREMGDFNPMQISNLSISLLAVYSFWNEYLNGSECVCSYFYI